MVEPTKEDLQQKHEEMKRKFTEDLPGFALDCGFRV